MKDDGRWRQYLEPRIGDVAGQLNEYKGIHTAVHINCFLWLRNHYYAGQSRQEIIPYSPRNCKTASLITEEIILILTPQPAEKIASSRMLIDGPVEMMDGSDT
jgi:hypothetical protein